MTSDDSNEKLPVSPKSLPPTVPTFGCVVYVRRDKAGVTVRVANLAGIEATASDERAALGMIVPAFKERVAQLLQDKQEIPWIDPPVAAEADEVKRFIPVHL